MNTRNLVRKLRILGAAGVHVVRSWGLGRKPRKASDYFVGEGRRRRAKQLRSEAVSLRRRGEIGAALNLSLRALRLNPDDAEAAFSAAVSLRRLGRLDEALRYYGLAVELSPATAKYHYGMAVTYRTMGQAGHSYEAFRTAEDLGMATAQLFYSMGRQAEALDVGRYVNSTAGLTLVTVGDYRAAFRAYEKAVQLDPACVRAWRRLAILAERHAEVRDAAIATCRAVELTPSPEDLLKLGRLLAAIGTDIPASLAERLQVVNISTPLDAFRRAYEIDPKIESVAFSFSRELMYERAWASAARLYWRGGPSEDPDWPRDAEEMQRLLGEPSAAARSFLDRYAPDAWLVLHAALLEGQNISLSYRAKQALAHAIIFEQATFGFGRVNPLLNVARAYAFIGDYREAVGVLRDRARGDDRPARIRILEKVAADIELMAGDPTAHRLLAPSYSDANQPEAEYRFRSMIEDRTVAIVGPGEAIGEPGTDIDAHDTVIRTKFVPGSLKANESVIGSRTDLSYYAAESANVLMPEIRKAVRCGELRMAVLRASLHPGVAGCLAVPGDLRYVPSENRALLRAGPFGVQRILYDIIRYRPQRVCLFNMDFFAGKRDYQIGYNAEIPSLLQARTLASDAFRMFTHDFLADFRFVQNLRINGYLVGDERVEQLLDLSPSAYLERLERKAAAERVGVVVHPGSGGGS